MIADEKVSSAQKNARVSFYRDNEPNNEKTSSVLDFDKGGPENRSIIGRQRPGSRSLTDIKGPLSWKQAKKAGDMPKLTGIKDQPEGFDWGNNVHPAVQ